VIIDAGSYMVAHGILWTVVACMYMSPDTVQKDPTCTQDPDVVI